MKKKEKKLKIQFNHLKKNVLTFIQILKFQTLDFLDK